MDGEPRALVDRTLTETIALHQHPQVHRTLLHVICDIVVRDLDQR